MWRRSYPPQTCVSKGRVWKLKTDLLWKGFCVYLSTSTKLASTLTLSDCGSSHQNQKFRKKIEPLVKNTPGHQVWTLRNLPVGETSKRLYISHNPIFNLVLLTESPRERNGKFEPRCFFVLMKSLTIWRRNKNNMSGTCSHLRLNLLFIRGGKTIDLFRHYCYRDPLTLHCTCARLCFEMASVIMLHGDFSNYFFSIYNWNSTQLLKNCQLPRQIMYFVNCHLTNRAF